MKKKRGFTLIELIIVIAIIAILMGILIPSMIGYASEAQKTVCDSNIAQIVRAYRIKHALDPNTQLRDVVSNQNGEFFQSTPACPSGGVYRGSAIGDNVYVVCSYHQNANDSLGLAVEAYLNLDYFRGMTSEEIKAATNNEAYYNNDSLRAYLLKNTYGGAWPQFPDQDLLARNGITGPQYIQPYIDAQSGGTHTASQDITVYINGNDGSSNIARWQANAIFNPEDGQWYTGKSFLIMNRSWEEIKGLMNANNWHVMQ